MRATGGRQGVREGGREYECIKEGIYVLKIEHSQFGDTFVMEACLSTWSMSSGTSSLLASSFLVPLHTQQGRLSAPLSKSKREVKIFCKLRAQTSKNKTHLVIDRYPIGVHSTSEIESEKSSRCTPAPQQHLDHDLSKHHEWMFLVLLG